MVESSDSTITWRETWLWAVLGLGPSWILVACIYQQVPAYERVLPEQYCIAAYLSLVISFSVAFIIFNLIYMYFRGPVPHHISVPFTMGLEIVAMFLAAAVWDITVDNRSIMLFLCAWIGGGVGGLQMVLVMPWMSRFKPQCISAFRVGTDLGSLLSAVVALIQKPGSATDSLFGPSLYFSIFGSLMIFPVMAYMRILKGGYGLRDKEDKVDVAVDIAARDIRPRSPSTSAFEMMNPMKNTLKNPMKDTMNNCAQDEKDNGQPYEIEVNCVQKPVLSLSAQDQKQGGDHGCVTHKEECPGVPLSTAEATGVIGWMRCTGLDVDSYLEVLEAAFLERTYNFFVGCFPGWIGSEQLPWLKVTMPYMLVSAATYAFSLRIPLLVSPQSLMFVHQCNSYHLSY